jgi:hypothetical protein
MFKEIKTLNVLLMIWEKYGRNQCKLVEINCNFQILTTCEPWIIAQQLVKLYSIIFFSINDLNVYKPPSSDY